MDLPSPQSNKVMRPRKFFELFQISRRYLMEKQKGLFFVVVVAVILIFLGINSDNVAAYGCSITEFSMTPEGQVSLGTHVFLSGKSSCATVKFTVDGVSKAEIGTSNQTETLKTEEIGTGTHEVCFLARDNSTSSWDNVAKSCKSLYVQGSQGAPADSTVNGHCWVSSFTASPSKVQIGQSIQLAGYGQCDGNARASKFYIDGKSFAEFGGNTNSAAWNTSGYSTGNHKVCFLITSGEWSDAAKSCTTVTLKKEEQASNPPAQGGSSDNRDSGNDSSSSSSSNSDSSSNNNPSSSSTSQTCLKHVEPFSAGDLGEVTPGASNNLRSCAGLSCKKIGEIPAGGQFEVLKGAQCVDGYWWWKVKYGNLTGWTAEGNAQKAWLIKAGTNQTANNNSDIQKDITVNIYSDHWRTTYKFLVNTRTCSITNGAEIISKEIKYFDNRIGQLEPDKTAGSRFVLYFAENTGQSEIFRKKVESEIKEVTNCYRIYYNVGKTTMDSSGLGNVLFGYAMAKIPKWTEDRISDLFQGLNKDSLGWIFDNYDDGKQRELGRILSEQSNFSTSNVEKVAWDIDLN
ncbi:MAG TPA: hypothetical protein DCW58_03245 [Candidatus Pacebacteria bacterium]|nr:hypothetical protein [Candidatus Paceibacterota bacterium]